MLVRMRMGARLERRQVLVIALLHWVRVLEWVLLLLLLLLRLAVSAVRLPRRHPVRGPSNVPNLSDQPGREREEGRRHGWRWSRGNSRAKYSIPLGHAPSRHGTAHEPTFSLHAVKPGKGAHAPCATSLPMAWSVRTLEWVCLKSMEFVFLGRSGPSADRS